VRRFTRPKKSRAPSRPLLNWVATEVNGEVIYLPKKCGGKKGKKKK